MASPPDKTALFEQLEIEIDPLTARQVQRLVFGGAALVGLIVFAVVLYDRWDAAFDYLSYVCPCLAALIAGAAFYMGDHKRDRSYFFWSLVSLLGGLVFYALARPNRQPILLVTVLMGACLCWMGFAVYIWSAWKTIGWGSRAFHVLLAAALAYELGIATVMAHHIG